ncbi:MAG TPA: CPBP family intramembrane glutamic endopeptidase [Thermoanaerobaculia bacterium]|nr:CPBP family intramembrane glutamic endopeptidase [Thermoanaerobaculia bacterium]
MTLGHVAPFLIASVVAVGVIVLNERYRLLSSDLFPSPLHRAAAYCWLLITLFVIAGFVAAASSTAPDEIDLDRIPFWTLFTMHVILTVFLIGWWALTAQPPLRSYLNIGRVSPESILIGIAVGVGGWAVTLSLALAVALLLNALGLLPKDIAPSPLIPWMAGLPLWQKATIVFMAMTVEEAFFRGWLQKRIGLIASTLLFAIAHAGYGQPFMLVGIVIISLIIGYTFYRTRDLVPCIIAHGVFDTIQLFVIVPIALRFIA